MSGGCLGFLNHQPYLTGKKTWKIMDSKEPAGICDSWYGTAPDRLVDRKAMFDVEAKHNAGNDVWSAGYVSMQHMYMQIYVHVCM